MTDQTATPETGPVDAPVSTMESVLSEFGSGADAPGDAADAAVREMTDQPDAGDARAPDDGEGKVEDAQVETVEPEEATPDADEQGRYTVKVNGEDHKVSLDELKKGYSRTEDYKAKTMALADDRRAVETEKSSYREQVNADYQSRLKEATDLFVQLDPLLAQADQIDWQTLAQQDPATYTQLRAAVDARQEAVGKARAQAQALAAEAGKQRQEQVAKGLTDTEQAIRASDPALADDAAFGAYIKDGITTLANIGLPSDDLTSVLANPQVAPAILSLVADAGKWRQQEKARASLPARKVTPVSQARSLRADADGSNTPRKAPVPTASRDAKVDWAVSELLSQGT